MKTAIVINAGIGALTVGLEQAGYKVIAAYETDKKAASIHKQNLDAPIFDCFPKEDDYKDNYELDLLAARIHIQLLSRNSPQSSYPIREGLQLLELLSGYHPRTFLFFMNSIGFKNLLPRYLEEISYIGYRFAYQVIDIGQSLGLPIKERKVCIIGSRKDINISLTFPDFSKSKDFVSDNFLEIGKPIDPWYYKIDLYKLSYDNGDYPYFCWNKRGYKPSDVIIWNPIWVPLVRDIENPRKITHREIANIKGFPMEYNFSKENNKSWLYKTLMYSENIIIVKLVAEMLSESKPIHRGIQFENLFFNYLEYLSQKHQEDGFEFERNPQIKDVIYDFKVSSHNQTILFELKLYNSYSVILSRIYSVCNHLSVLKDEGIPVLVVANEVSDSIKNECSEKYGVHLWDVGNLLWLFEEYPELKSEFVAFLDYAIDSVEAKPPAFNIVTKLSADAEIKSNSNNDAIWKQKLSNIEPGKESFREYEDVCVEILKYVLGDYLTLWKKQQSSNDGLYRFDLCCKIKSGTNQEFFDTIKNYFNTKYIVFEFKNYKDAIGQKEIYTTEKYLYEKALRKVAIIISRKGADDQAMKAVKGSLRETGKLIICLSDQDLLDMINIKKEGEQEPADLLVNLLDELLVHLEK